MDGLFRLVRRVGDDVDALFAKVTGGCGWKAGAGWQTDGVVARWSPGGWGDCLGWARSTKGKRCGGRIPDSAALHPGYVWLLPVGAVSSS